MTREQLEHIVRAAGSITDEQKIIVLGSQSILGTFQHPPDALTVSREADVCPMRDPSKVDLISGAIGEVSLFDSTFGYYAHGLPPESCPLPKGWESRLVPLRNSNTRGVTALCLAPLDLAGSKLVAGRDKDKEFVTEMLRHNLITEGALNGQIALFESAEQRQRALQTFKIVRARLAAEARQREKERQAVAAAVESPKNRPQPPSSGPRMGI